jgi:putative SOS response-associated peptidase YedK
MCGRYTLTVPPSDIESRFDATFTFEFGPRYNAAPGQSLPVITAEEPEMIQRLEWGLIPSWADDRSEHGHINARAETVQDKRSFATAYESRRCLVPADGFYEWVEENGETQPYRVTRANDGIFAMAGLYERWTPPQRQTGLGEFGGTSDPDSDPEPVETFTIVTTEPNETVAQLHHRMAVMLDRDDETAWLHGERGDDLLVPYDGSLSVSQVSTAVNDPKNDTAELLEA